MDDGKISAIGTHEELMENSEIYKDVYKSQQEGVGLRECKNKNEMPRQESNHSQGQGSHGAPGKGGKKPDLKA